MSSSGSEEDFIEFGTPLEPLEEDEIPRKKPLTLEEQVVKDKQGRRRFHGAFTGGFSAGFFNSVGSLEGWTPTSFKSSRREKNITAGQRPEDFMDDEDLDEFGIAPTLLQATQDYSNSNLNKRKRVDFSTGPIPGVPVLESLLQPVRDTIGIKLLKRMGWKPGQGTGPRVSRKEKKRAAQTVKKIYGCMLPPGAEENQLESDSDSESDLDWDNITFAPSDYEPFLCTPKENTFGIGYVGLDRNPVLSSFVSSELRLQEKNRKVHIKGQAFGVGAFEEEDEDIYTREDMTRYDFELGDKAEKNEKVETKFYKGVLEGFVAATKKPVKKVFPPPVLPKSFKPYHKIRVSRFEPVSPVVERNERKDLKRHEMKASDRQMLIADTSREVITETQKQARKLTEELVSTVKIDTSRFKPFAMDPDKQSRYEKYLKLIQVGKKDCLKDLQPITMSEWDREREKNEFEQAARLFQPLSGVIKDRFTSASQPDDMSDPLAVVEKLKHGNEDQIKAAEMKMYGRLTREYHEWQPCSLLCKRFNVPEPRSKLTPAPVRKKPTFHIFDSLNTEFSSSEKVKKETEPETASESESKLIPEEEQAGVTIPITQNNLPVEPVVQNKDPVFEDPQEKIDLFKAIFLDSDDEEEEKPDEKEKESDDVDEISTRNFFDEKVTNDKRNTSPARGFFENIDLDSLNAPMVEKSKDRKDVESKKEEVVEISEKVEISEEEITYGPKLPDRIIFNSKIAAKVHVVSDDSDSSDNNKDKWVEKKSREKKHKKKDKKHKKDKHKSSKHKHKKHKR